MIGHGAWERLLETPAPGQHVVQFYSDVGFLARAVARFAAAGFREHDAVLVIATPFHQRAIVRCLDHDGLDVVKRERRGQWKAIDAARCLNALLVDGLPDPQRFEEMIGGEIDRARAAGYRRVRAFGEMVDLLRRHSLDATMRLETLWSKLLTARGISLLCTYALDTFDPQSYRGMAQRVSAAHSDVIPVEDYPRLERAVERAFTEVFGTSGDADALREHFLSYYARPAAMPDGEAAILAATEFVPSVAEDLLSRAREHYCVAREYPVGTEIR